jgi:hypothetical protein
MIMEQLPTPSGADYVHSAARAAASLVPVVGGPLQVLIETIFVAPVGRRKDEWLQQLADVVAELQQRMEGLTPEELAANDMFVTAVAQASQFAARTHQQEKLDALKNAVLHSVLPGAPAEDQQLMFLRFIDELTPWHLRLLSLFKNPGVWLQARGRPLPNILAGGIESVIELAFHDLRGQRPFYQQILRDLQVRGLMLQGNLLGVTMTTQGLLAPRIEPFGEEFLRFIGSD